MGKTNNKQKFLGGKNVMKKYSTLKRLAAGAISAMMVFTSISAVFAAETTTTAQTITVETSDYKLLGSIVEGEDKETNIYSNTNKNVDANYTVTEENGEKVYTVKECEYYKLLDLKDKNNSESTFNTTVDGYDKCVFSIDIKGLGTPSYDVYNAYCYRTIGKNRQENIEHGVIYNRRIKFTDFGNQSIKKGGVAEYDMKDNTWHNVKIVHYLKKGANGYKIQYWVDDVLVRETEKNLTSIVPDNFQWTGKVITSNETTQGLFSYKNARLYVAKEETVKENETSVQKDVFAQLDKTTFKDTTEKGKQGERAIWRDSARGRTNTDENGYLYTSLDQDGEGAAIYINQSSPTYLAKYFTGDLKGLYDSYSINFDMLMPKTTENSDTVLQYLRLMSQANGEHKYMGCIMIMPGRIKMNATLNNTIFTDTVVKEGEWANVEIEVDPSDAENIQFTYYVNGNNVGTEKLDTNESRTSTTGIIETFYASKMKSGTDNLKFDNFKITLNKKAHKSNSLNATVTKEVNDLKVKFNKALDSKTKLLDDIVVKNNLGNVLNVAGTLSADGKTITYENVSNADWYSVQLPERLMDEDGYIIKNNIVSTPHFAVDSAKIDVDSEGNNKLNITYTNTLDEKQNVMVMLAAYDTDGRLVKVDVKSYGVNASGTVTPNGEEVPTIETTEGNLTVRGYIWGANNCPIYNVVTLSEVE